MIKKALLIFSATSMLAGCASHETSAHRSGDPFESFNRGVFAFNEGADRAIIGPVASTYETVIPSPLRTGAGNFLSNLGEPVTVANNLLQGNINGAADSTGRFLMNSTLGLLGIFDVATEQGIEREREDFGQTLAVWGVPDGPFLMLPLMGPSNLRDTISRPIDSALEPLNYGDFGDDAVAVYGTRGVVSALNTRVALDSTIQTMREQADPYTAMRRGYELSRRGAIQNGQESDDPYKDLPDFDAYDEFYDE